MDRRRFLSAAFGVVAGASLRPGGLRADRGDALGPGPGPGSDGAPLAPRRPGAPGSPPATAVRVDPRIELYYTILQLSGFRGPEGAPAPVMTDLEFPYRSALIERFDAFRAHPVVRRYAAMAPGGFWMGHPVSAMLHLGDPPALPERVPVDPFTVRMAGGRAALDAFLDGARHFAATSRFMEWFGARDGTRAAMVRECRDTLDRDHVADLVAYYGERRRDYTLLLAPLAHPGGFGPRVRDGDGGYRAFAVVGPKRVTGGLPRFGTAAEMRRLLWHEFSHAHVNHLTERHVERLRPAVDVLQTDVREQVTRYVPWDVHVADWVSEHVVRGVTTRLAYREIGPAAGDAALELETRWFPHVPEVVQRLEAYEHQREKYPTLEHFFPQLVTLFETLARP
jgi:hypothetical protein